MANPSKKAAEEMAPVKEAAPVAESVYTAEELARNCKAFHTRREVVDVALRLAGRKTATFSEAKKIIDNFKNREVK